MGGGQRDVPEGGRRGDEGDDEEQEGVEQGRLAVVVDS